MALMEKSEKKILLSGVKPTGRPHLANYFGAMKQFVDLQNDYNCHIMIADLHALISVQNGADLKGMTLDLAMDYLAIGLDPAKVTLFKQSDVTEHTELAWIFNCLTTMPYLARAHAFKDAEAKNKEINVGLFDYPILMAADILMYDADIVPVGQDQKQHIEITRDTAEKFNRIYGETFKLPEPLIIPNVQTIPGIDGQKMSKSYNNHIPLFSSDDEIRKLVMSIVTDSSGETPKNVYALHKLFRSESELATLYEEKKGKYKDLKEALAADIISFVAPLRERREAIAAEPEKVRAVLQEGAAVTRDLASKKMKTVREKIGLGL
jgi:tryptophanyl-tRNA synthetase